MESTSASRMCMGGCWRRRRDGVAGGADLILGLGRQCPCFRVGGYVSIIFSSIKQFYSEPKNSRSLISNHTADLLLNRIMNLHTSSNNNTTTTTNRAWTPEHERYETKQRHSENPAAQNQTSKTDRQTETKRELTTQAHQHYRTKPHHSRPLQSSTPHR